MQQKKRWQTCWGAKWIRQRKRDQLHIFRRTLIGGEPLSLPVSLPHPRHVCFLRSHHSPSPSPLTGEKIDPNKGQLHSFPSSIFKASRCRRWSIKYQTYKACGLWGRRRSTSIDTRRRGGGQLGRRRHWLSEVSAAVAHCTAPSSSPNPAQVSSSRAVGWTKNSASPLSPQNPNHDDVGEKKDNCLPGWISVHGWGGLDISELYSEKTVSTHSPGHFYW